MLPSFFHPFKLTVITQQSNILYYSTCFEVIHFAQLFIEEHLIFFLNGFSTKTSHDVLPTVSCIVVRVHFTPKSAKVLVDHGVSTFGQIKDVGIPPME